MRKRPLLLLAFIILVVIAVFAINSSVRKRKVYFGGASSLSSLYNDAKDLESKGLYLEARAIYRDILERSRDEELNQKTLKNLSQLNMEILFSPVKTEKSILYAVKRGDTLGKIAKDFNTTVELIKRSNNLGSDIIRIGQKLKISTAGYGIIIDCSQNILTLTSDEVVLKTYTVSTGIENTTPLGRFKIVNRLKDPVWYKAGAVVPSGSPENILGSRWMGLSIAGYGIHGTTEPETIGQPVTAGCIRMREPDVQELYAILPIGTEVAIIE